MKKPLFLILLATLILTGCSSQKLSQDQLFEKKQECLQYKESLQKEIDTEELESQQELWIYHSENIWEIFYSTKENSCFALTSYTRIFDWNTAICNKIINLLNNTQTIYCNQDEQISYYDRLQELKGE